MAEGITTPAGAGGLMRFSDEYPSKLRISPEMVIVLIAVVIVGITILKIVIK